MGAPAVLAGAPRRSKGLEDPTDEFVGSYAVKRGTSKKGSPFFFIHSKRLKNTEWTFERETG